VYRIVGEHKGNAVTSFQAPKQPSNDNIQPTVRRQMKHWIRSCLIRCRLQSIWAHYALGHPHSDNHYGNGNGHSSQQQQQHGAVGVGAAIAATPNHPDLPLPPSQKWRPTPSHEIPTPMSPMYSASAAMKQRLHTRVCPPPFLSVHQV
jgi:hypothetical protein